MTRHRIDRGKECAAEPVLRKAVDVSTVRRNRERHAARRGRRRPEERRENGIDAAEKQMPAENGEVRRRRRERSAIQHRPVRFLMRHRDGRAIGTAWQELREPARRHQRNRGRHRAQCGHRDSDAVIVNRHQLRERVLGQRHRRAVGRIFHRHGERHRHVHRCDWQIYVIETNQAAGDVDLRRSRRWRVGDDPCAGERGERDFAESIPPFIARRVRAAHRRVRSDPSGVIEKRAVTHCCGAVRQHISRSVIEAP